MSEPNTRLTHSLTATGLLLLLIQAALLAISVLALATAFASQNPAVMTGVALTTLFVVAIAVVLSLVGKVLCLFGPSSAGARSILGASLFAEVIGGASGLLPIADVVKLALAVLPVLLLLLYLRKLSQEVLQPQVQSNTSGAVFCVLLGTGSFIVFQFGGLDELTRIGLGVVAFGACLYGYLLYLRSLSGLRHELLLTIASSATPSEPNVVA